MILLFISTKYRTKVDKKRSYLTHLRHQLQLLKYSIISPIVLILLATPRIILAFTLQCMKSAREPVGLFLLGYFISFIPSMVTFIVFILPSQFYRKECYKTIVQFRTNIQRRFHLTQ